MAAMKDGRLKQRWENEEQIEGNKDGNNEVVAKKKKGVEKENTDRGLEGKKHEGRKDGKDREERMGRTGEKREQRWKERMGHLKEKQDGTTVKTTEGQRGGSRETGSAGEVEGVERQEVRDGWRTWRMERF